MGWKEVYAESFGLQPQQIVGREILEEGRKGGTVCLICKNTIPAGERLVKILVKQEEPPFYLVCTNCDNKIEEFDNVTKKDDLCGMRPCIQKVEYRIFYTDQEEKWFCAKHKEEEKGKSNVKSIEKLLI